MGTGFHGGFGYTAGKNGSKKALVPSSIQNNVNAMSSRYPTKNGYFGEKGKNHRVIYSEDQYETAFDFYSKISHGGLEKNLPNDKGKIAYLDDGTKIVYRSKTSTPDSPAVEITIYYPNSVKGQKIHFLKGK